MAPSSGYPRNMILKIGSKVDTFGIPKMDLAPKTSQKWIPKVDTKWILKTGY